jgi:hypothetical protein
MPSDSDPVEFTCIIDRDTLNKLRTVIQVRIISGQTLGVTDAFLFRLVEQIDEGKDSYFFKIKKEID